MRLLRGARGENIGHSEIFANNLIFFSAGGGHENKIQKLGRILLEHNEAAAPELGIVRVTGWKRHFDRTGDKTNSSWKQDEVF